MNNFSKQQLEKIKHLLQQLMVSNTDKFSYFKVYNIKTYKDDQNNFYISYTTEATTVDGIDLINTYTKILTDGSEVRLSDTIGEKQLKEMYSNLETIIL